MLEIEAKYPLTDFTPIRTKLALWNARLVEDRVDADHYYNAPDRDFAQTDEAFRVRRIGSQAYLTYKGPKLDAVTKTRKEIEVPLQAGETPALEILQLIESLGYRPVAIVRKNRQIYELERDGFTIHFCLDDVACVGTFLEIEIVAEESKLDRAREILLNVADELGLRVSERRSYLQMLLGK